VNFGHDRDAHERVEEEERHQHGKKGVEGHPHVLRLPPLDWPERPRLIFARITGWRIHKCHCHHGGDNEKHCYVWHPV
jgi:hypothetical protein